jgi:molybdopterin converting factor small subunit
MARKTSEAKPESHELTAEQTPGLTRAAATIAEGHALTAQLDANVRAVAAQIGYQLPADCTDPDLIQRDISANMRRSVEACLEVGRGLAVLKTACGHGNFVARLDVLGMDRFVAAKFMQAATKFSNVSSTAHLTKAIGNQTKLFEMLVLDDEQLEELELTGQTGELHLDEIATMSVKELRAALREAKADAEAKDQVLAEKNQKLDELDKKLRKRKEVELVPWDERVGDLNGELSMIALGVEELLEKYWVIFEAMRAAQFENDEKERARSMLAKNFHDRTQRIVERVAHIQASMFEEFDGYINEPKHLLAGSEG